MELDVIELAVCQHTVSRVRALPRLYLTVSNPLLRLLFSGGFGRLSGGADAASQAGGSICHNAGGSQSNSAMDLASSNRSRPSRTVRLHDRPASTRRRARVAVSPGRLP